MLSRDPETHKLRFNVIEAEITFDDLYLDCETPEEIQFVFDHLFAAIYQEAIGIAKEKGFNESEYNLDVYPKVERPPLIQV